MNTYKAIVFSTLIAISSMGTAQAGQPLAKAGNINAVLQTRIEARVADKLKRDLDAEAAARNEAVAATIRGQRQVPGRAS